GSEAPATSAGPTSLTSSRGGVGGGAPSSTQQPIASATSTPTPSPSTKATPTPTPIATATRTPAPTSAPVKPTQKPAPPPVNTCGVHSIVLAVHQGIRGRMC